VRGQCRAQEGVGCAGEEPDQMLERVPLLRVERAEVSQRAAERIAAFISGGGAAQPSTRFDTTVPSPSSS
jgi:hypothetical protein